LSHKFSATTWWDPYGEKFSGSPEVKLNFEKLADMFCVKEVDPVNLQKNQKSDVSILDLKRSKNCGIMLGSRFKKMEFLEMKQAILDLDEKILSAGDVSALAEFVPTKEEVPPGSLSLLCHSLLPHSLPLSLPRHPPALLPSHSLLPSLLRIFFCLSTPTLTSAFPGRKTRSLRRRQIQTSGTGTLFPRNQRNSETRGKIGSFSI
jgi:hypothetical protein